MTSKVLYEILVGSYVNFKLVEKLAVDAVMTKSILVSVRNLGGSLYEVSFRVSIEFLF